MYYYVCVIRWAPDSKNAHNFPPYHKREASEEIREPFAFFCFSWRLTVSGLRALTVTYAKVRSRIRVRAFLVMHPTEFKKIFKHTPFFQKGSFLLFISQPQKKHVKNGRRGRKQCGERFFCIKKIAKRQFWWVNECWVDEKQSKSYAFGVFLLKISWALCLIAVRVLSTFFFSTLNLSEISL